MESEKPVYTYGYDSPNDAVENKTTIISKASFVLQATIPRGEQKCKMVESLNQQKHQKQQDSGSMFLKSGNDEIFLIAWIVTTFNMIAI